MLGAGKGVLVAAASRPPRIEKYGMEPIKTVPWAEEQVKTSWAAKWNEEYHPVPRIWASPPVRHLVNYVDRMGLRKPGEPSQSPAGEETDGEGPAVRTASRPSDPQVASDAHHASEPPSPEASSGSAAQPPAERLDRDDQAIADLKAELKKQPKGPN